MRLNEHVNSLSSHLLYILLSSQGVPGAFGRRLGRLGPSLHACASAACEARASARPAASRAACEQRKYMAAVGQAFSSVS